MSKLSEAVVHAKSLHKQYKGVLLLLEALEEVGNLENAASTYSGIAEKERGELDKIIQKVKRQKNIFEDVLNKTKEANLKLKDCQKQIDNTDEICTSMLDGANIEGNAILDAARLTRETVRREQAFDVEKHNSVMKDLYVQQEYETKQLEALKKDLANIRDKLVV